MFKLDKYGELLIDKILFEANYPVLFTCVNKMQELFLVVCCQNNKDGKKWLITKAFEQDIIDMLQDKTPIRDVFIRDTECQISAFYNFNDNTFIYEHNKDDWNEDSIYLPKKGEFIDAEPEEFDEEIGYFRKRMEKKVELSISAITYNKLLETNKLFSNEWFYAVDVPYCISLANESRMRNATTFLRMVKEKFQKRELNKIFLGKKLITNIIEAEKTELINYSGLDISSTYTYAVDIKNEREVKVS